MAYWLLSFNEPAFQMPIPILLAIVRVFVLIIQVLVRLIILAVQVTVQALRVLGTGSLRLMSRALAYAARVSPQLAKYAARAGESAAKNGLKYTWQSVKYTARSGFEAVKTQAKESLRGSVQNSARDVSDGMKRKALEDSERKKREEKQARTFSLQQKYQQALDNAKQQASKPPEQAYRNANIQNAQKPVYTQENKPDNNMPSLSDLKKYIPVQIPMPAPSGGGGGGGGIGSVVKIVLAVVVFVGLAIGALGAAGSPLASAWSTKITSAMQNTGGCSAILGGSSSIGAAAGDFMHTITVNPWEETKSTEEKTATETTSAAGLNFVAEDLKSPGITFLPSQPKSGETLTVRVGIYNPMKDFVASGATVTIENQDEIKSKTGLDFISTLVWTKCEITSGIGCNIQPKEYAVSELESTSKAKEITEDKIAETAVNFKVVLAYAFASTRKAAITGPFAGSHLMPMNEFTFTIKPDSTVASELDAWDKSLVQRKAGGIVEVNLDNRAGLDWDSTAYLDYSIKNTGASSSLTETVSFIDDFSTKKSMEDKVIVAIPSEFSLENTDKYTFKGSDAGYGYYSANPGTVFTNTLNENRTIKELDKVNFGLKIKTPVKSTDKIGKQYTISIYFLDKAFIFVGEGLKDTAVKP